MLSQGGQPGSDEGELQALQLTHQAIGYLPTNLSTTIFRYRLEASETPHFMPQTI